MLRRLLVAIVIVGAGAIVAPAFAHQQKVAITRILFSERTGNIEVMHRFYLHDAEAAVGEIFGTQADILAKEETRLTFASYVTERFALADQTGEGIELGLVGFELEGAFFWIYQESEKPAGGVTGLEIRHGALRDLWPEQVNTVNIEGRGPLQTLTFSGDLNMLDVVFD